MEMNQRPEARPTFPFWTVISMDLMATPLLILTQSFRFGVQSICFITLTWIELLRAFASLQFTICWRLAMLPVTLLSLPIRAFVAMYRERMLEMQVLRMRDSLENAIWENKELRTDLLKATHECNMVEVMLKELESEHDQAIAKFKQLVREGENLKKEIQRLREVEGKTLWNFSTQHTIGNGSSFENTPHFRTAPLRSSQKFSTGAQISTTLGTRSTNRFVTLAEQRQAALFQSLFSALLSMVVGIIVWEARDPCIPLVVALFSVVSMSFTSVIRFFATVDNKPASDAVALLSLNWFILGTLAYPSIPRVLRVLTTLALACKRTIYGLAM